MDRISYMEKLEGSNYDVQFKNNLQNLMQMGCLNFEKNYDILKKVQNNLENAINLIFEQQWAFRWSNLKLKFINYYQFTIKISSNNIKFLFNQSFN